MVRVPLEGANNVAKGEAMSTFMVLIGLVPIVVFVILDLTQNPKVAIYSSIVTALGMGIVYWFVLDEWDQTITGEIVLFALFGAVALKMRNPRLFKFQPVVVGLLCAAFLAWHQWYRGPYLLKAASMMEKLGPEYRERLESPQMQALLAQLSVHCIYIFFIHALVLAWVAWRHGSVAWALWRAAIWPILIGVVFFDATMLKPV